MGGNKRVQKGIYQEPINFVKHQKINMRLPGHDSLLQQFSLLQQLERQKVTHEHDCVAIKLYL